MIVKGMVVQMGISFLECERGYDKEQVDAYVRKISEEYANMHREYTELTTKYQALSDNFQALNSLKINADKTAERLEGQNALIGRELDEARAEILRLQSLSVSVPAVAVDAVDASHSQTQAVAKALIDAEIMAQQVVSRAQTEALGITDTAKAEAGRVLDEAKQELGRIYSSKAQAMQELNELNATLTTIIAKSL